MTRPLITDTPRWAVYGRLAPAAHWLGLGLVPPEGLHGDRRGLLTRRYVTGIGTLNARVSDALARAYGRHREVPLMHLLRPQRLDDALWRKVYALMVTGGPVIDLDLVHSIARLTAPDQAAARAEAERLFRAWDGKTRHG